MGRVWRRYLKEIRSPTFISATLWIKRREEKRRKRRRRGGGRRRVRWG
jgi:hypothetical protein